MKSIAKMIFWMVCFLCIIIPIKTARILAILPLPSYSHQIPYRPLWINLSQRHEVVLITTDPIKDPSLTNLTEINFKFNYDILRKYDFVKNVDYKWLVTLRSKIWFGCAAFTENVYKHPDVRKMYAPGSGQKFDLVIAETLCTSSAYALAHRFKAPLIGVLSLGLYNSNHYLLGAPVLSSHPSAWEMENSINLSLWQRIIKFIQQWYHIYCTLNHYYPEHQAIAEKYLGNLPDIRDLERNMSIVFHSQQATISYARPTTINVISFGNLHISKELVPLPTDLQEFLKDAPNGFIYMSLGTNVLMSSFSKHVQNAFYDVLSSLPCKIVWKYDKELLNKSDNIYLAKWFPQQSVLAHPKIRLFMYQGGLQSTEEAIYNVVPLLGFPVLADQQTVLNKMVSLGVAKYLKIKDISKETLNTAITDLLNDKSYKERMLKLKTLNEDKPYDSLENVIWWIEYVIRNKGAPHLHTSIAYDPWYQRYDMDIIAILSIVIFVTILCALVIIYKLLKIIFNRRMKTSVDIRKKVN